MKKLIAILLMGVLFLFAITGCLQDNNNEQTTPQKNIENTTPHEISDQTTTPNESGNNNKPVISQNELDKNSNLIVTLTDYLQQHGGTVHPVPIPFASKINDIKQGAQPLHIVFNSENYYYVCAYHNSPKDLYHPYAEEYVWLKYENEVEIQEYYNEQRCQITFQINRAFSVTDILSSETVVPTVEYFQVYTPTFENGVNTKKSATFDKILVYPNKNNGNILLLNYNDTNEYTSISCIMLDDQWYIPFRLDTLKAGEAFNAQEMLSGEYMIFDFGEYYEEIVSVIDTEKYRVDAGDDRIAYYGVISFEDFVKIVEGTVTPPEITPTYQRPDYLDKIFKTVEADADAYDKLSFYISREDLHFELKNSGLYDNDSWSLSHFEIIVNCDYSKATNEEWYQKCPQPDRKSLNEAFYNQYKTNFFGGDFSNILFFDGLHFIYRSVSEFEIDYSIITSFLDLDYVTGIAITYSYGIPYSWMED